MIIKYFCAQIYDCQCLVNFPIQKYAPIQTPFFFKPHPSNILAYSENINLARKYKGILESTGLAKKFVRVFPWHLFHKILWKNPNKLFGQPNKKHSEKNVKYFLGMNCSDNQVVSILRITFWSLLIRFVLGLSVKILLVCTLKPRML